VELTLYSLIKKFGEQLPRIVGSGLALAGLAYVSLSYMPQYYGHSALIRVANLGPAGTIQAMVSSPLKSLAGDIGSSAKKEALKFIEYKYIESPEAKLGQARVANVEDLKESDLIELTVHGLTPEAALKHAEAVLKDLQTTFQPRLDDIRADAEMNLAILDQQRKSLQVSLANIATSLEKFGYSSTLVQQRGELELALVKVQTSLNQIQSGLSPEKIYNFSFTHQYSLSSSAVFPNMPLMVAIGFLLGCGIMMFAIFIRMEDQTVREQIFRLENSGIFHLPTMMRQNQTGPITGPVTNPFIDPQVLGAEQKDKKVS
jgi:capsular polysaccharide biosynthesis protein